MAKNTLINKVKCGVENCVYNKDYACSAEALEVNPIRGAGEAHLSDDTCCTTFKDGDK